MKVAIWLALLINTVLTAPETDLCDICECYYSNNTSENKSININCVEKSLDSSEYLRVPGNIGILDLSHNLLTSARIGNAEIQVKIQILRLNGNKIQTVVEPDFYRILNVEFLDLSYNHITEIIEHPFHYLKDLKKLDLSGNILREIPENTFSKLKDLMELRLDFNPLHSLDPNTVSGLPSLMSLSLSNCALSKIDHDAFKGCDNLQHLDLSENNLALFPTKAFENADQLRHINLNGNPIEVIDQRSFWFPTGLEEIELNGMPVLRQVQAMSFSRLKNLYRVSISNNKALKELDANAFEGAHALHQIDLSKNALETIEFGEDMVAVCHDINLNLMGNPWNCDCKIKWMLKCSSYWNTSEIPTCSSPDSKQGFKISLLAEDDLVCDDGLWLWGVFRMDKQMGIVLIIFGILGILASLCGIGLMIKFKPRITWNRRVKDKDEDIYYVRMEDADTKKTKRNRAEDKQAIISGAPDDVVLYSK